MLLDVDTLAIVLSESFGIVFFFLALVFFKQSRKFSDKQESLKKATTDENCNGPCYSSKWVMSHVMKHTKLLAATPALVVFVGILGTFLIYGPPAQFFFYVIVAPGYVSFIALIGATILLLETNAYQAYSYGRAIQKVAPSQLSREDQSYMELAKDALENATVRFLIIGITFAVVGPFMPQIFDGLVYALATYARILFHATVATLKISPVLAFAIALIFLGILFYLPEVMGRIIFRRVKLLAQRIWERWRKR